MNITRNKFLAAFGLILPFTAQAKEYTNFIIVLLDDMGYGDLNITGAIDYKTPNLDKMAKEGMFFSRYYSAQAVSGASRAGLLTGCYPNRIGIQGAPGPDAKIGLNPNEKTIADILKTKGYKTAIYGKWHLGHLAEFLPTRHGFDEYYGIPYSNDMWPKHPTMKFPPLPLIEGEKTIELNPDQSKFTTEFTNRALGFIEKNKKNPFFVYLAHPMPHVPLAVSDKFKGKSKQGLYGDVIMEIDWSIEQIMNKLKKLGLEENTLVLLTSDNGPWLNYGNHAGTTGGLREGKGTVFEGGQRVPCIVKWKGKVKAGSVCNELTSGIDILATFAEIAKADLPNHKTDGISFLPLLLSKTENPVRNSFYYYYRDNELQAVTDGKFKLVLPHKHRTYEGFLPGKDGAPGKLNESLPLDSMLLFDLRRDPGERYNVFQMNQDIADKLIKMADEAREDLGDRLTGNAGKNRRPVGRAN